MVNAHLLELSEDFPYPSAKYTVFTLTLCIQSFTLFHVSIVLYFLGHNSLLHKHLKIVSYNLWVTGIIKCCANIFINVKRIFFPDCTLPPMFNDFSYIVREVGNNAMISLPVVIVIERMYSILNAKTYEKHFSWMFIIVVCGSSWMLPIWIMINRFYLTLISLTYTFVMRDSLLILFYMLYFVFYYRNARKSIIGLTLSERYQRAENETSYGAVRRFAITAALIAIFSTIYLGAFQFLPYVFNNVSQNDKELFFLHVFKLTISCFTCVLPYHFVHIHPSLHNQYRNFFHQTVCKRYKINTIDKPAIFVVKTQPPLGLKPNRSNETQFYFLSLADQWNSKLNETKEKGIIRSQTL